MMGIPRAPAEEGSASDLSRASPTIQWLNSQPTDWPSGTSPDGSLKQPRKPVNPSAHLEPRFHYFSRSVSRPTKACRGVRE